MPCSCLSLTVIDAAKSQTGVLSILGNEGLDAGMENGSTSKIVTRTSKDDSNKKQPCPTKAYHLCVSKQL